MSITYTPSTNFGAKDSLPTNDSNKVIKGSEFTTEFTAIQTAFGLAAPAASPTFTGTVTISSVDINGGAIDGTIIGGTTPAAGTFSSLTATTADINGGTIDGVTIGGSSAGAITGTTGQFNTSLNVDGTVTADGLTVQSSGDIAQFTNGTRSAYLAADSGGFSLFTDAGQTGNGLYASEAGTYTAIYTNSSEKVRIDSIGNVGIGTASLSTSVGYSTLSLSGSTGGQLAFQTGGTGKQFIFSTSTDLDIYNSVAGNLKFHTSNTERMRLTSSGAMLLGTATKVYVHETGLRIRTNEAGSHVLDAALSLEGPSGDFYALNMTGTSDVGFGILAAFSPATDYLQWQYRSGGTSTNLVRIDADGDFVVAGALSKGSGSFKIDHPLPAKRDTHHLVHSFVEAPQADNIYRGKVDLVAGTATVNIDTVAGMTEGTFVLLNREVQCFTSNETGWTAVRGKVDGNILTIEAQDSACADTISWMVVGERQDQHMYDTKWTDENGKVIVEPLKETEGA